MLRVQGMILGPALRVHGLGTNLISEGVLQNRGYEVMSKGNWRKVMLGGEVVISAALENGLFVWRPSDKDFLKQSVQELKGDSNWVQQQCFVAGSKPESNLQLWHLRMGHLNVADLHILKERSTGIKSLSGSNLQMCISCCRAKASSKTFRGNADKASRPLQTVFVDLWGPMQPAMDGSTYALLMVDEFTSYTWGFYLQQKHQATDFIIQFIKEHDRVGQKVATIRSDRGGEFSSLVLKAFFQSVGVIHAQSPSYTPQFQGKVERMNRTVGEMAHAMRIGAKLDVSFWSLAWAAAVFLRNRSPTAANPNKATPYFMFFGKVPKLENLFVFGSKAEAFVDSAVRKKGEERSKPGIFVGYDEKSRAYKFLPKGQKKWITVRTLMCDEGQMVQTTEQEDNSLEEIEIQPIETDNEGTHMMNEAVPEVKQPERQLLKAAKSTQSVTRQQLSKRLVHSVAMVVVDDLGGEHYLPGNGINLDVPKSMTAAF